jgi:hypothetical protein
MADAQRIDGYLKDFFFKSDLESKELYIDNNNQYIYMKIEDGFLILTSNPRNYWVFNVVDYIKDLPNDVKKIKEVISDESDYTEKLKYIYF